MKHASQKHGMSERSACKLAGQARTTQRRESNTSDDEPRLLAQMWKLSKAHSRYGYRRIHRMLCADGWRVNHKRIYRLCRREGMLVPRKRSKRRRIGDSSNSCVRHKAEHMNHVWSYDFVFDRTEDGRPVKILTLIDEFTRESLCIHVARSIKSEDLIGLLVAVMLERGMPAFIRSDNGPEFVAKAIRAWLETMGTSTLFVEPGSPWENGYIESFNSRLRDELLNGEVFTTLAEAKYLAEDWRIMYNTERLHSSLNYITPKEFAASCAPYDSASLRLQAHSSEASTSLALASPLQLR